ncbi:erv-family thiol oxidoreductase [Pandoravirus inopinatum]|uniref:Sulfhydryl oxidase n=1 Tax=Pandoravirus inopinatum TaxID=1605721 RepID=A0A0B5JE47_9VIRU|nr:erv-family thiol oxidoreductase [Pandoravirus inopinatum]AJF98037.1 erv-family thiol oxidoreductase [Pandoravirus inopinatum]
MKAHERSRRHRDGRTSENATKTRRQETKREPRVRPPPLLSPLMMMTPTLQPTTLSDGAAVVDGRPVAAQDGGSDVMHLVGPPMWETLHYAAFQCPEPFDERASALIGLARGYVVLLPCAECRGHFAALLDAHPPEVAARSGRQAFARWTVDAHNAVNARLGKPLFTYDQAARRYARGNLHCRDPGGEPRAIRRSLSPAVAFAVALAAVALAAAALAGVWFYLSTRGASRSSVDSTAPPPASSDTRAPAPYMPKWPRWGPTDVR